MRPTSPHEHLPYLGRVNRARRLPTLRNALIVAMDRAVIVESASRYLAAGHSMKSVALAMGIPLTSLWKWVGAARRSGPAGLVPGRWRSGRRKAPRPLPPGSRTAREASTAASHPPEWSNPRQRAGDARR